MKYRDIYIPFVGNHEIKQKADNLRKKLWGYEIPVEIEEIIEIKLKIRIIPIPNMFRVYGIDAQITSNFVSIYVDQESYENDGMRNRFRFSLAHELGHYVLHKDFYGKLKIENLDDIYLFYNEIDTEVYSNLEAQANKFANYFLIPRDILLKVRNEILEKVNKKHHINSVDVKTLNSYLANYIAPQFNVSSEPMEYALNDLNNKRI